MARNVGEFVGAFDGRDSWIVGVPLGGEIVGVLEDITTVGMKLGRADGIDEGNDVGFGWGNVEGTLDGNAVGTLDGLMRCDEIGGS